MHTIIITLVPSRFDTATLGSICNQTNTHSKKSGFVECLRRSDVLLEVGGIAMASFSRLPRCAATIQTISPPFCGPVSTVPSRVPQGRLVRSPGRGT